MGRGALQGEEVTCKQDLCSGRRGLNAKSLWLEVREEEVGLGECGEKGRRRGEGRAKEVWG